jgi:hypothetical protein
MAIKPNFGVALVVSADNASSSITQNSSSTKQLGLGCDNILSAVK